MSVHRQSSLLNIGRRFPEVQGEDQADGPGIQVIRDVQGILLNGDLPGLVGKISIDKPGLTRAYVGLLQIETVCIPVQIPCCYQRRTTSKKRIKHQLTRVGK